MRFYHISLDTLFPVKVFTPYIPDFPMSTEDIKTPRICVSTNIEGCLSAVPWGGRVLEDEFTDLDFEDKDGNPIERSGVYIRVYEFEYDGPLKDSKYLYEHDLVRDALATNEYWLLEECKPSITYTILLTTWDEYSDELISYEDDRRLAENPSLDLGFDDSMTKISNIKYEIVESEPLTKIVDSFNEKCKSNQYSMYFDYVEPIHYRYKDHRTEASLSRLVMDRLYNKDSDMLIPLLKELIPLIREMHEHELGYSSIKQVEDLKANLIDKLDGKVSIKQGCARVVFLFDDFVVKTEYTEYSDQFNDEFDEYYYTILNAVKRNTNPHALLPLITIISIDEMDFEIFPRAKPFIGYKAPDEWYEEQSSIRNCLGFKYMDLSKTDLKSSNLGYYADEIVILDAGAMDYDEDYEEDENDEEDY